MADAVGKNWVCDKRYTIRDRTRCHMKIDYDEADKMKHEGYSRNRVMYIKRSGFNDTLSTQTAAIINSEELFVIRTLNVFAYYFFYCS